MAEAGKQTRRKPLKARPQRDVDSEALFEDISTRFAKTLEHLAK
jgi:hypothetical protein